MQETGAAVGDQISNPGENSAWHATTNLGFKFLVDFWHVSAVHENQSEFWHWSNRGVGAGREVEQWRVTKQAPPGETVLGMPQPTLVQIFG